MENESLTNPTPPTGVIPTEVPLGINTTTTHSPVPNNIIPNSLGAYGNDFGIYLTTFTISNTMAPGTRVFTWNSEYPLSLNNQYSTIAGQDYLQWRLPWSLIVPFFSRMGKVEWEMNFKPIKVADCRVSVDIVFNYGLYAPENTDITNKALANDSLHKNFDDTDDNLTFNIPMFFPTDNVQIDSYRVFGVALDTIQPAFLPTTSVNVFIRNTYQNSLIQPDSFQVLVTLRPKISNCVGLATRSTAVNNQRGIVEEICRPHFLRTPQN